MKRIVYLAHPISGDVEGNLKKLVEIGRRINKESLNRIVPIAPYFFDLHCLNDEVPEEREKGIANNLALFEAGFINEVWLFGDYVSEGMETEVLAAFRLGIPVVPMSPGTERGLAGLKILMEGRV